MYMSMYAGLFSKNIFADTVTYGFSLKVETNCTGIYMSICLPAEKSIMYTLYVCVYVCMYVCTYVRTCGVYTHIYIDI
jgi:hypothetical protein